MSKLMSVPGPRGPTTWTWRTLSSGRFSPPVPGTNPARRCFTANSWSTGPLSTSRTAPRACAVLCVPSNSPPTGLRFRNGVGAQLELGGAHDDAARRTELKGHRLLLLRGGVAAQVVADGVTEFERQLLALNGGHIEPVSI